MEGDEPILGGVVVLGAGRMGLQVGIEYAMAGSSVRLVARDMPTLRRRLKEALDRWARFLPETDQAIEQARQRLSVGVDWEVDPAPETIVESLPENFHLKVRLLNQLVEAYPSSIVASNTSSIQIDALGQAIGNAKRTIGVHYLNPPFLNPLVEVIPGRLTSRRVVGKVLRELGRMGKSPIVVGKALPGSVWNRLQFAVLREAMALVEDGVVEPEGIDIVMELGLGRRWSTIGPMKTAALGGVETFVSAAPAILRSLSSRTDLNGLEAIVSRLTVDEVSDGLKRDIALAADLRRRNSTLPE